MIFYFLLNHPNYDRRVYNVGFTVMWFVSKCNADYYTTFSLLVSPECVKDGRME